MKYKKFGKQEWMVSKLGFGLASIMDPKTTNFKEIEFAIDKAIDLGYNFFDTAWSYGNGESEKFLGKILKKHSSKNLYVASKIPSKRNLSPNMKLAWAYTPDHIISFTEKTLQNLGIECIPLQQFHLWEDAWAENDSWKNAIEKLKKDGKILSCGLSLKRNEANNCLQTLDTGLIDSVQVVYNVFEQEPDKKLFSICKQKNIAVINRAVYDNGMLADKYTEDTLFEKNDYRSNHFKGNEFQESIQRLHEIKKILPEGMTIQELALQFVLQNKDVNVYIIGTSNIAHVEKNIAQTLIEPMALELMDEIKKHNWQRNYNYIDTMNPLKALYLDVRYLSQKIISNIK